MGHRSFIHERLFRISAASSYLLRIVKNRAGLHGRTEADRRNPMATVTINETLEAEVEALPEDMRARLARIALLIEQKGLERVGGTAR